MIVGYWKRSRFELWRNRFGTLKGNPTDERE